MSAEDNPAVDLMARGASLSALRRAVPACRACHLWKDATQAVFGAGRAHAAVVLVGEAPGDREDREGKPFVGPAGAILTKALEQAGLASRDLYLTNAVKHFKFEPRGKRRIHKKPDAGEITACHPWLEGELRKVRPSIVVCLGVTAARAVFGRPVKIGERRGRFEASPDGWDVTVTVHPSAILRAPDADARAQAMRDFVADLREVARRLRARSATRRGT